MRFDYTNIHHITYVSKVHCGSALGPGASGLPYYCAPLVCVPNVQGGLAVWRFYKQTNKPTRVLKKKLGVIDVQLYKQTKQKKEPTSTNSIDPVNLLSLCLVIVAP